jgi:hypothetical protein
MLGSAARFLAPEHRSTDGTMLQHISLRPPRRMLRGQQGAPDQVLWAKGRRRRMTHQIGDRKRCILLDKGSSRHKTRIRIDPSLGQKSGKFLTTAAMLLSAWPTHSVCMSCVSAMAINREIIPFKRRDCPSQRDDTTNWTCKWQHIFRIVKSGLVMNSLIHSKTPNVGFLPNYSSDSVIHSDVTSCVQTKIRGNLDKILMASSSIRNDLAP